jgi:DNA-binding transcriptional MerR regulator
MLNGPRHLFTAAEAARLFGIPPGSVRAWKAKGQLYHMGLTQRGQPMYDRDDLLALRDGTRRRTQRKPRTRRKEANG